MLTSVMPPNKSNPFPLFDTLEQLQPTHDCILDWLKKQEAHVKGITEQYQACLLFLTNYQGSLDTYNTYRRELERFCQWCWLIEQHSLFCIESNQIHDYMSFVNAPPKHWITDKQVAKFQGQSSRLPNEAWRPFVQRAHKTQKNNLLRQPSQHQLANKSLAGILAVLSTFYQFLQQQDLCRINPIALLRQKNRYVQKQQTRLITRRLSEQQWRSVIACMQRKADLDELYERHLFLLSAFYLLGLRISECSETPGRIPSMGDFYPDRQGHWWFTTVGKGNKQRDIAVPDAMLHALKRFRRHLGLSALPIRHEMTPLVPKNRGEGGLGTRQIRNCIQFCFDQATEHLRQGGHEHEAEDLQAATVHWLRHTAISADVVHRPREHVRDDAGHESSIITDQYIDIDRRERHASAKHKLLIPEESDQK